MRLFLLLLLPAVIAGAKYPMAPAYYPPEEMNTNIPIAIMNPYQSMMPDTPGMDDYQFYYEKDPKPAGPGPVPPTGAIPGGSAQQPGPSPTHSGSFNRNEIEVPVTSIENPDPYREAMMEGTAQTKYQGDPDAKLAKPFLTKVMESPSASPYDTGSPGSNEIAKNNLVVPTTYDDSAPGETPYSGEPSGGNKPFQNNPKGPTGAASAEGSPYDQGPPGGAAPPVPLSRSQQPGDAEHEYNGWKPVLPNSSNVPTVSGTTPGEGSPYDQGPSPPVPLSRSQQPGDSEHEYSGWKPVLPNSSNVPTVNGATPGEGSPYDQRPSTGPAPPVPPRPQQPGDSEYEYNGWTPVPKGPSTEPYGSDTGSGYPSGNDDDINLKLPKSPSVSTGTVDPRGNGGSSEQDNSIGRSNISPPSHQNGGYTATNTANAGRESKGGGEKVLTPKDGFPRAGHFNLGEPNAPPGRSPDGLDKSNEWTPGSYDRVLDRQHSNLGRTSSGPGGSATDDLLDPSGNIGEGWNFDYFFFKYLKTFLQASIFLPEAFTAAVHVSTQLLISVEETVHDKNGF
uniref:PrP1 protein n=1 Tax=Haemonchus contortus TaxID=6289 RepID=W6NCW0_HAECO